MKETPDQYYARQPEPAKAIGLKLRSLVKKALPDASESIKWRSPMFEVGGVNLMYIATVGKGVNLGLMFGADLEDSYALVKGTGKNLRHAKFARLEDIDDAKVLELIKRAAGSAPSR